ncbi:transposase [Bradyrhizobium sp. USDA 4341]
MELNLHANATTTPKTRAYIQRSKKSVAQLAAELGVSETTIYRWRGRTTVGDRSHRPNNLTTSLSAVEERAVCELRTSLQLPLDDLVEVMQRCINAKLSRSAIHRCLQRNGISRLAKPDKPKPGIFETASIGFIHIDVKYLPALQRRTSYAFVAIDRATRYVFVEIHVQAGRSHRDRPPQTLPGRLPARGSHHPDRQRRRVHRPLCCRQEEQAGRETVRRPPL